MIAWIAMFSVVAVIAAIAAVLLCVPAHWRGMREFPAYRLADAVYNEYAKKRHEWLRVPLDTEVCHDNVRVLRDIFREVGIRRWWLSEGSALGLHRDGALIAWDDDVDMTLDGAELERFVTHAIPRMRRAGFRHVLNSRDLPLICFVRRGEKVDVAFFFTDRVCSEGAIHGARLAPLVRHRRWVPLAPRLVVPVPASDAYYAALYGPGWRTPNRRTKSDAGDRSAKVA